MAFLDEVDEVREKAALGKVPRTALVGVAAITVIAALFAFSGMAIPAGSSFVVEKGSSSSSAAMSETGSTETEGAGALLCVYIVGAISHPGVYQLSEGSRVNDAVEAAGGLLPEADAAAVNLARTVADGEQVLIPQKAPENELADASPLASVTAVSPAGSSTGVTVTGGGNAGSAVGGISSDGTVNINIASESELETLNGIGPATAKKIIASRETEGPFTSKEDLKRVSGIGDKKYAAIADSITV